MMNKLKYILPFLFMFLLACTTTKVVQVPVDRVHIEREVIHQRDSIYVGDSVVQIVKNDSVFVDRWHTRYKERWRVDTLFRADTITKVIEVQVPIEVNHLYWWQKALMWLGVTLFAYSIYKIAKYVKI